MGKLDDLRKMVEQMFAEATDKASIDKLSLIKTQLDGVQNEQKELEDSNKELLASYKEVVKHSVIQKPGIEAKTDTPSKPEVSFETALDMFIKEQEKK